MKSTNMTLISKGIITAFSIYFFVNIHNFVLCSKNDPIPHDHFFDFKSLLMYYNEPLLLNTSIDELHFIEPVSEKITKGASLEGSNNILMAEKLIQNIQIDGSDSDISQFRRDLQKGIAVVKSFRSTELNMIKLLRITKEETNKALSSDQKFLDSKLPPGSKIILPISWSGASPHAIVLVLENIDGLHYNMTVINTGDGLEHHQKTNDPNSVYLWLYRFWIEFKNIHRDVIFSDSCWFIRALALLENKEFTLKLEDKTGKATQSYFYGSILANFSKYLSEDVTSRAKLIPEQQSGTCSLSSLMATMLYYAKDELSFSFNRLFIGLKMLETFLNDYENDLYFKTMISDGFDSISRKLFSKIPSTLARHVRSYLENLHPTLFDDFSRLEGSIADWNEEKKSAVLEILKSDESLRNLLSKMISLIQRIHGVLEKTPIDVKSVTIADPFDSNHETSVKSTHLPLADWRDDFVDSNSFIETGNFLFHKIDRTRQKYNEIAGLIERIEECKSKSDFQFATCILDAFRSSGNGEWWEYLNETSTLEMLGSLLDDFKLIMQRMMTISAIPNSLDDLVLFAHLQIGVWKCAVLFDNSIPSDSELHLGLGRFAPPSILELAISQIYPSITAIRPKIWSILTNFSPQNAKELFHLLQIYKGLTSGDTAFISIKDFLYPVSGTSLYESDELSQVYNAVMSNTMYKELFDKMMHHPEIEEKINEISFNLRESGRRDWSDKIYCKFGIFLAAQCLYKDTFKQFTVPFSTFIWMFTRTGAPSFKPSIPSRFGKDHPGRLFPQAFALNFDNSSVLALHFDNPDTSFQSFVQFNDHKEKDDSSFFFNFTPIDIPKILAWNSSETGDKNIFYQMRHSLVQHNDFICFETWLNYIKSVPDATIFDEPYFIYLTDRILNMPYIHTCETFDVQSFYFIGFHRRHIKDVFHFMLKMIQVDLKHLEDKRDELEFDLKDHLIKRSSNIGIILSKFIQRLDFDELISPKAASKMLSKLYKQFYNFARMTILCNPNNEQFSALNVVLAHISNAHLRDSDTKDYIDGFGRTFSRSSLTRTHWFLAKMNFIVTEIGRSVLDDTFNHGIPFVPVVPAEISDMKTLLQNLFLSLHEVPAEEAENWTFSFHENGDLVKIQNLENYFVIQLSSGRIVKNGISLPERNIIYNSDEFQSYFEGKNDKVYAKSAGEIFMIDSMIIYTVPDYKYKGNIIVILHKSSKTLLFRKYNNHFYLWTQDTNCFIESVEYKWIEGYKLYAKIDQGDIEVIAMKDDEKVPLLSVSSSINMMKQLKFKFPQLASANTWKILDTDLDFVHKSLRKFTETDMFVAKGIAYGKISTAFIYPGLWLNDHPLIVVCGKISNELRVINQPDLYVDPIQSCLKGNVLRGTLVIQTRGKQRSVLVPILKLNDENSDKVIHLERIPLVKDFPAPQTLFQRLLLAFICIKNYEFDFALDLLHPFTSIVHNEPFTEQEFEVLHLIVKDEEGGPEAAALKVLTYIHAYQNSLKFPLHQRNLEKIEEAVLTPLMRFHMSIRELPETFYIYHYFPEFAQSNHFKELLRLIISLLDKEKHVKFEDDGMCFSLPSTISLKPTTLNLFDILEISIESVLAMLLKLHQPDRIGKDYLNTMKRLLIRNDSVSLRATKIEMVFVCAAESLGLFYPLAKILREVINNPDEIPLSEFTHAFWKTMQTCTSRYGKLFNTTELSSFSDNLDPDGVHTKLAQGIQYKTLISEFKVKPYGNLSVVTPKDLDNFRSFAGELKSNFKPSGSREIKNLFRKSNRSKVLLGLCEAIGKFIKEKTFADSITIRSPILNEFKEYLSQRIKEIHSLLDDMEKKLTLKTRNDAHSFAALNEFLNQEKAKFFENLYSCYQKQSIQCLQAKFVQFTIEECEELMGELPVYYSNQVLSRYLVDLQGTLEKEISSIDVLNYLLDELDKIEYFNSRLATPTILNFEYRSEQYRLKREQVEDIGALTGLENDRYKSIVIQRMMAAGKTLVLGTISTVIKALNSTKLSILVPPSSLYQSNLSTMQSRTYKYFQTRGHSFIFTRFQFLDADHLNKVVKPFLEMAKTKIKNAMKAQEYFVLSPENLQSFMNSYIEVLNTLAHIDPETNLLNALKEIVLLYTDIYNIFRKSGSIILDEIDLTLDPKKELNFPTLDSEPFNMHAATLLTDLMEFTVFDAKVHSIGLDILGNNQSSLSVANYTNYLELAFKYIELQLDSENSLWQKILLGKHEDLIPVKIMKFLRDSEMSSMAGWIQKISRKEPLVADALLIVKVQLWNGLRDSMKSAANLNYGAAGSNRPGILYAVPYLAANTPSPSSEFADRWETLHKTLMMLAATPCSSRIATNMIGYVRKSIIEEASLNTPKTETTTYKNICTLIPGIDPMSLSASDPKDINLIHDALKHRSPVAIRLLFSYALDEIFRKMKFPVEQITSNVLNMTSMFASVQGYSGTIDNVNILPKEVVADAFEHHFENEKKNGGIALKLIEDSSHAHVYQLADSVLKKSAHEIIVKMIEGTFRSTDEVTELSAIIDAGAFFKNFRNRDVAKAILQYLNERIQVVLYYNEDSNQVEFVKWIDTKHCAVGHVAHTDSQSIFDATQCPIERRFTFYDQRHITGSDIVQPTNGRALLTVGARVLLRDILQGTLRMRKFMTSQKVHVVSSTAAFNLYRSKSSELVDNFRVSDVLELGAMNEDEKQLAENRKLAYSKIDNEIRRFIMDEISSSQSIEAATLWFKSPFRNLFIKTVKEDPISWMNPADQRNATETLSEYIHNWLEKMVDIIYELGSTDPEIIYRYESLENDLNLMIDPGNRYSLVAFLGENSAEQAVGFSQGTEVEMQLITEIDLDLEMITENIPGDKSIKFFGPINLENLNSSADLRNVPSLMNLNDILTPTYFAKIHRLLVQNVLLTDGLSVGVSSDLVDFIRLPQERPLKIFSQATLEGTHILIQRREITREFRAILLSPDNADSIQKDLNRMNEERDKNLTDLSVGLFPLSSPEILESKFWLCDLSGSFSVTNDSQFPPGSSLIDSNPVITNLIFDSLVFNGSLDQILAIPALRKIYESFWLQGAFEQNRAKFLLLRMHVLSNRAEHIFSSNNPDLLHLKNLAKGVHKYVKGEASSSYKRQQIDPSIEDDYFTNNQLERPAQNTSDRQSTSMDPVEILSQILQVDDIKIDSVQKYENFNMLPNYGNRHNPSNYLDSQFVFDSLYDSDVNYFLGDGNSHQSFLNLAPAMNLTVFDESESGNEFDKMISDLLS